MPNLRCITHVVPFAFLASCISHCVVWRYSFHERRSKVSLLRHLGVWSRPLGSTGFFFATRDVQSTSRSTGNRFLRTYTVRSNGRACCLFVAAGITLTSSNEAWPAKTRGISPAPSQHRWECRGRRFWSNYYIPGYDDGTSLLFVRCTVCITKVHNK